MANKNSKAPRPSATSGDEGALRHSWLVQRLVSPRDVEIHTFGGGYAYGGLSEAARALTHTCFDFDYMGAAEFEFGAVPEALGAIWARQRKDRGAYARWSMSVDVNSPEGEVLRSAEIYVIAPKLWRGEIETRIVTWAGEGWKSDLKEPTRLLSCLAYPERTETKGWLELDNGFFFFMDKEMFESVCVLLEVGP